MHNIFNRNTTLHDRLLALHVTLGRCFCLTGEYMHALTHFKQITVQEVRYLTDEVQFRKFVIDQVNDLITFVDFDQLFTELYGSQEMQKLELQVLCDFSNFLNVNENEIVASYRSATCSKGGNLYKGYSLNRNHYQNEIDFFKLTEHSSLKEHLPVFLGSADHFGCKVLIFKDLNGYRPCVYEWPALLQDIIKVLADSIYRNTQKVVESETFLNRYLQVVSTDPNSFIALDFTKEFLNDRHVHLVQIHGNLKSSNVLLTDANWFLVDWEVSAVAPVYVDLLKGVHDFTRRECDKKVLLELPALLRSMLFELNTALGLDPSNHEQVQCNLYAALWHLVAQEVQWGNKDCLNENYRLLLPLLNTVYAVP